MDVRMPDGTLVRNVPDDITQTDLLARYNKFKAPDEVKPSVPTVEIGPAVPNLYQQNKTATSDIPAVMPEFAQAIPEALRTPFTGSLVKGITGAKSSLAENQLAGLMELHEADAKKYGANFEKAPEKEKVRILEREQAIQEKFADLAKYGMQNKAVEEAYGKSELSKKIDTLTAKPEYKDATGLQKTGMYLSTLGKNLDEMPGYIANLGAESLPQSISMVAAAAAARFGGLGTKGAALTGGATSAFNEFGGIYADLRSQGMSHEEAWTKAGVKANIIGAFDAASFNSAGSAANRVIDNITKKAAAKETIKEVGKETGKQALFGGAGEGLGSLAINQPFDPRAVGENALGEAFGAPLEAATTYKGKTARPTTETKVEEPQFTRDEQGNLVPTPPTAKVEPTPSTPTVAGQQQDLFSAGELPTQVDPSELNLEQQKASEVERNIFALQQQEQTPEVKQQIATLQAQLPKGPGQTLDTLQEEHSALSRAHTALDTQKAALVQQRNATPKLDDKLAITEQIKAIEAQQTQIDTRRAELQEQAKKLAKQITPEETTGQRKLKEVSPIVGNVMSKFGLAPKAPIRNVIKNLDMTVPEDRATFIDEINKHSIKKAKINMEEVDKYLSYFEEKPSGELNRVDTGAVEPSVPVPREGTTPTEGLTAPVATGMENNIGTPVGLGAGTETLQNVQPDTLEEPQAISQQAGQGLDISKGLFGNQANTDELSDYKIQQAEKKAQDAIPVGDIKGTYIQKLKEFGKRLGSVRIHNHFQDSAKNKKILTAATNGDIKTALAELAKSKNPIYRQIANIAKNIKNLKIVVDDEKSETQSMVSKVHSNHAKYVIAEIDALREAKRRVDAGEDIKKVSRDIILFPKGLTEEVTQDRSLYNHLYTIGRPNEKQANPYYNSGDYTNPYEGILENKEVFDTYVAKEEQELEGYEDSNRKLAGYSFENVVVGGMYDATTNTIYLNSYLGEREGIFAHELAHAITHNFLNNPSKKNTPAYKAMDKLYQHVKENFTGREDEYGLTNIDEFVAEGFSNPMFQYELAKMKYENTSALSKFVDSVARILGLKNDNALTELLNIGFNEAEKGGSYKGAGSNFNLISTITDAFKNWFGDSKAVNEDGTPMRLYHGTTADISQFKLSSSGALGAGVYLTPDSDFASQYAQSQNANILPVYARIENPLVIKTVKGPSGQSDPMVSALVTLGVDRAKAEKIVEKAYEEKGYITKEVMARAQKQGYDGIFQYMNGELSEVVAFSPNQVKSIFNKTPTFGPKVSFNLKPSSEGEKILSNLKAAGSVEPKAKTGWFTKEVDDADNALNKSMLDKVKDFVGFGNFFSFDQGYMNVMRSEFLKLGNEGKIVMKDALDALRRVEITQVLYRGQLAAEAINTGKLVYDAITNRFKVIADPDNMDAIRGQLKALASRVGVSLDDALAAASKGFEANRIQSIYDKMNKAKAEITRIEKKIQAKVETEQNKKMLKKLKDNVEAYEKQTQHMTRQEAMEGMKIYNGVPEVQEIARMWGVMRKRVIDELVRSSVTSNEKAERWLDEMAYVPFFRTIGEQKAAGMQIYKKGLGESMKEYAFEGSMLPVENTIGNMYQWMQWSLSRAISNQHQQVALDQMRAVFPDMVKDGRDPKGHTFSVYKDGIKHDYTVANPLVAQYFMGVGNVIFGSRNIISKWANLFTKGITLVPGFSATQLILKDTYEAMHTSGVKNPYGIITNIFQEMYKTATDTSEARKELISRGQLSTREHAMAASHDADIATKLEVKEAAIHSKLIGMLGKFSAISDNLLRQAVYQQLRSEGVSEDEAASRATEVFNYRRTSGSTGVQFLSSFVPFLNAFTVSTQVAMNTVSGRGITAQTREKGLSTLAQATVLIGIGNLIYMMMVGDSEEYKRMNRYKRDKSYVIPGTGMVIPLREGWFILDKLAAEYAYNLAMNSDVTDAQMFKDAAKRAVLQQITPPTPGIVSAPLGAALNRNIYSGRDIVNVAQSKIEPEYQFNKDTSEFSKLIGKESGMSPLKVDYFLKTMFGGYTTTLASLSNEYIAEKRGKPLPSKEGANIPLEALGFGPYLSKPGTPNVVPDLYTAAHEVDKTLPTILKLAKTGDIKEARSIMETKNKDIVQGKEAAKIEKIFSTLNRAETIIRNSTPNETVKDIGSPFYGKPYTPEIKKAMIDDLDKKRETLTPKVMALRKRIYEK
jgi:hypothetical protein